jgi:PleD family two-component response regulator
MQDLLFKYGCNVIQAASFEEAFEIISNQDIDYIFTATILKDMDLGTFVRKLEEDDLNSYPIILISSIEEIKSIKNFFKLGITDFILKKDLENSDTIITLLKVLDLRND